MSLHDFVKTQFSYGKPYSIGDLNDYKRIIYLDHDNGTVFKAAQARFYGFTKTNPVSISVYDWLASELYEYINNGKVETQVSFDDWHHNICDEFSRKCNTAGLSRRFGCVRYGLAQKFVNIALKYIYCFVDADSVDKNQKFDFCHIALDSYTYCPKATSKTTESYLRYYGPITKISGKSLRRPFYSECVNPYIN